MIFYSVTYSIVFFIDVSWNSLEVSDLLEEELPVILIVDGILWYC